MTQQFWMVSGTGPSIVRHAYRYDAEKEAKRLARQNPGQEYVVLEAVSAHATVDVRSWSLRPGVPDDDIPF